MNKYWNLSWWYIFDILDKQAHLLAIEEIWECVTANASIDYFNPTDNENYYLKNNKIKIAKNKIIIIISMINNSKIIAIAKILFIKK